MESSSPTPEASSKSSFLPILLIIILLIILALGGYFGYKLIVGDGSDSGDKGTDTTPTTTVTATTTTTTSPTSTATPTESTTPTPTTAVIPDGWTATANTPCGYTAYRPPHWYYRIFTGCAMGLDPNPIPTASEYWGAVAVFKLNGSVATEAAALKADLEAGATQQDVTISGRTWTIVEGTFPASEISDAMHVKAGFVSANGKTFKVASMISPTAFAAYEDELDKEMEIITFP